MDITWETKVINVYKADLTVVQVTPTEIYDLDLNWFRLKLRDLEDDVLGITRLRTHRHNTEVTLSGITFARVINIINGYTITFEDGQYAVNLVGANSNVSDRTNVNSVSIRPQNSAGLTSSPAVEYASFNGGVIIDATKSNTGTAFPRGTEQMPLRDMTDALAVATYRGFKKLYVHSDYTFDADANINAFTVVGQSHVNTHVTILDAANVTNVVFQELSLQGIMDGGNTVQNCILKSLTYLNGHIHNCALEGVYTLSGNTDAFFDNCQMSNWAITPVVNMGVAGQNLIMTNYTGKIIIRNLNGTNKIGIGLVGGVLILEDTVTNGTVHVSGTGILQDSDGNYINSGTWNGGVTIINDLHNTAGIADSVWQHNNAQRLMGLNHENAYIDLTNFDAYGQLISARIRMFDSKQHCDAATSGGNETVGLIASYNMTTAWEGANQYDYFKQTREG